MEMTLQEDIYLLLKESLKSFSETEKEVFSSKLTRAKRLTTLLREGICAFVHAKRLRDNGLPDVPCS